METGLVASVLPEVPLGITGLDMATGTAGPQIDDPAGIVGTDILGVGITIIGVSWAMVGVVGILGTMAGV